MFLFSDKQEIVDTRYNGAYLMQDGSITIIAPSNSERVRLRHFDDGQLHSFTYDDKKLHMAMKTIIL